MNDLLLLSGSFEHRSAPGGGRPTLPSKAKIDISRLNGLSDDLERVIREWPGKEIVGRILVSVKYRQVVAKSNRLGLLLKDGDCPTEQSIVGARYEGLGTDTVCHIMTHYVSEQALRQSIETIGRAADIVRDLFGGSFDADSMASLWDGRTSRKRWDAQTGGKLSRTAFAQVMRDAYFVLSFASPSFAPPARDRQIVTLYKTEKTAKDLLDSFGIVVDPYNYLDNSVLLTREQYVALLGRAPYLVSMQCDDISRVEPIEASGAGEGVFGLPAPSTEPIVGVIDTPFEANYPPYFSQWVEPQVLLSDDVVLTAQDYTHGTSVTSLIVDAGGLNPRLDDGCGHFRVRHFGVATCTGYSSFEIMRKIEQIVSKNCDEIKVWNLSLGSAEEVDPNAISPEAAMLDDIQKRYGVVFVVAGTNDWSKQNRRIGAPADSINALVVNSVGISGNPASYSRHGPTIGFHRKPDVAYYGGDGDEHDYIQVCTGTGALRMTGTSFAAPLITRKVAYLVHVLNMSCELAKALIIDSAAGWNPTDSQDKLGYGVVPIRIEDVVQSKNDEIKVAICGVATEYEMYNYHLPVPTSKGTHPYVVRATLCYAPECNRDQGVDYTCTELDLHLGRLKGNGIVALKGNTQGDIGDRTTEDEARKLQRKWDNVKHIAEPLTSKTRPRKAYENPLWAIKLRKTSRFQAGSHEQQRFALVITLKELHGKNRYEMFVQQCNAQGWIVNRVDLETRVLIYQASQIEIEFK